jgi:subtilisin family serine protease
VETTIDIPQIENQRLTVYKAYQQCRFFPMLPGCEALMKPIGYVLIVFIGLGISSAFEVAGATTTAGSGFINPKRINFSPDRPAVPGEILVKFKPATFKRNATQVDGSLVRSLDPAINEIFSQLQVKAMRRVFRTAQTPLADIYRLRFEAPIPLFEALKRMASDANVEWVEPNYVSFTFETAPNDPYFSQQWGLEKIQAAQAWDISQGKPSIIIAVIDTGVDYDHLDLEGNIWHNPGEIPGNRVDDDGNGYEDDYTGWDFVSVTEGGTSGEDMGPPDSDPMDFHGHGTHCAGIASAVTDNNTGVAGATWNCKIMALRAGYKDTRGDGVLPDSDTAAALHYAADNGAHVISMSWGGDGSSTLSSAIDYAYNAGCVLVAAAGNDDDDLREYPAAYFGVIAVAASGKNDDRVSFSNYGSWVDIAAPGTDIHSTTYHNAVHNDTYGSLAGTSMAAPFVAGVAGLILSQDPTLTADTVTQRLLDSADDISWDVAGPAKRLNAYKALLLGVVLDTPANLAATAISSRRIDLMWGDVSYEDGYKIQRKKVSESFQQISTTAANVTSYSDMELQPDTTYTYRVCAYNAGGHSDWSNAISAATLPPPTITINTPSTGEIIKGGDPYTITWRTTGSDIDHIHLLYSENSGASYHDIVANTPDEGSYELDLVPSLDSSTVRIKAIAEDASGNLLAEDITGDFTIDSTPPETEAVLDGSEGKDGWYTSDVIVILSATDSASGVNVTQYKVNDDPWKQYSGRFTVTGSEVYYYSQDKAGNTEAEKHIEIRVDKAAPETSLALAGTEGDNGWYISDVTVTLSATDSLSGVKETGYRIDGGSWQAYMEPFTVSASTVYYRSEDNAGNVETERSRKIEIDTTAPSIPVVMDEGDYTNSTTQLYASWISNDEQSDVAEYWYAIGTKADGTDLDYWTPVGTDVEVTASLDLTEGQTYYIGVKAKNGAGLLSGVGISNGIIVNAPPVVSDIPDVSFPEDGSDSSIDLDDYIDDRNNVDSEITWTYTGNTYVNVAIDPTTHVITFTAQPNWNGSQTVTFTATDPGNSSGSAAVTVIVIAVNDPPTVSDLRIEPSPPGPADNLHAGYTYDDLDGGAEISTQIKWYKNGVHQPYDDIPTLPYSATLPGEEWHFTATPSDGIDLGDTKTSPSVIIGGLVQKVHLYQGWNLISTYLVINADLSSILAPIEGLYRSVWTYDAESWRRYIPGNSLSNLDTIEPGKGYWLDVVDEVVLTIAGERITDAVVSLHQGWNLVGCNSPAAQSRVHALSSIVYASIWTYDSKKEIWLKYVADTPGFLNTLIQLEPGKGYWIYVE